MPEGQRRSGGGYVIALVLFSVGAFLGLGLCGVGGRSFLGSSAGPGSEVAIAGLVLFLGSILGLAITLVILIVSAIAGSFRK